MVKNGMTTRRAWLAALWFLPLLLSGGLQVEPAPVAAQAPSVITTDEEPHHHLALKNDLVKVFEITLAPRDAFLMHRHDNDDVSIVVGDATTVSTTPGQADILRISKAGEINFARSGRAHSVRNIGQTAYRSVSIDLLHTQTGARNLCGGQISNQPANCPAAVGADSNAPRADLPQFETDQIRVTLTRIRPRQQAIFGEPDRDDLIVTIDEAVTADQQLASGSSVWIARGGAGQVLKNNSDKEVRVVTVAFKP